MSDALTALGGALPAEALSTDVALWEVGGLSPIGVVRPATLEEVRATLEVASRHRLGVIPMGGRTHLGPESPTGDFVALSTGRLEAVEDYEPGDLTVTAQAGITLGTLGDILAAQGQWLPADPPLTPVRTLGGLVATGAGGALGTAYGSPRDHVLGVTVVTGDGRVLRLGGRVMKNVAGFDLVKLMVGSHGTLGVIVSASLRLFPIPSETAVFVIRGESPGALLPLAAHIATASVVPASARLVQGTSSGSDGAALVVRVQGAPAAVDADARTLLGDAVSRAELHREGAAAERLAWARDHVSDFPVVVRAFALPALLPQVLDAVQAAAPDAHLNADIMAGRVRAGMPAASVAPQAVLQLRARMEALGGTVVLERATPELAAQVPVRGAAGAGGRLAAALRARFDPAGILSPGRFTE